MILTVIPFIHETKRDQTHDPWKLVDLISRYMPTASFPCRFKPCTLVHVFMVERDRVQEPLISVKKFVKDHAWEERMEYDGKPEDGEVLVGR